MAKISLPSDRISTNKKNPKRRPTKWIFVCLIAFLYRWLYNRALASVSTVDTDSQIGQMERKTIVDSSRIVPSVTVDTSSPIDQNERKAMVGSSSSGTKDLDSVTTIGYFISITGCSSLSIVDAAAVVKHSIHLASVHGNLGGKYDYRMHAIYHPSAASCAAPLADVGYKLEERSTPVAVEDIQGDLLREKIVHNGCCGEKELIKLEAYTFTQYPVVVHIDLDVMILKPLDPLFDAMIDSHRGVLPVDNPVLKEIELMWPQRPLPPIINAFFTRDCKRTTQCFPMLVLWFAHCLTSTPSIRLCSRTRLASSRWNGSTRSCPQTCPGRLPCVKAGSVRVPRICGNSQKRRLPGTRWLGRTTRWTILWRHDRSGDPPLLLRNFTPQGIGRFEPLCL